MCRRVILRRPAATMAHMFGAELNGGQLFAPGEYGAGDETLAIVTGQVPHIPGTRRTRIAVETMRDWLSLYRNGGFEALYPKTRADRGQPRRLPPEVAEVLVSLKSEQPALSVKALIKAAREHGVDHPLAPSTVHRLLSREGLLDKHPGDPVATDRRRFAFRDAGELWMSDVMHGPKVRDGRRRRKSFLIAFTVSLHGRLYEVDASNSSAPPSTTASPPAPTPGARP